MGVGVGQPRVQGEQRDLQAESGGDEGERGQHRHVVRRPRQPRRHVAHVQRAGGHVEQADPGHEERRADGAENEVAVARQQCPAVAPERDQHIGRERRDLHEDECVERIVGDRHAEQPGERQQKGGVKRGAPPGVDLGADAVAGERHDRRRDAGHEQQHEAGEKVDPILDPPGRRPAAENVGDGAAVQHPREKRERDSERRPGRQRREAPGAVAAAEQRTQGRAEERRGDLQRRQIEGDHPGSSGRALPFSPIAAISSSSMVPQASRMRTARARPSARVATPTTMAVRMRT